MALLAKETTKEKYSRLLQQPQWFVKRQQIIARDGGQCQNCGTTTQLQAHHRQYHFIIKANDFRLPWEYDDDNYVTLCSTCHAEGHKRYKVPVFNI
ncbi:HNH endonuclease [Maribellus sediminis]|uniref:HNH endonuclease n=1 Tax=Maribellus sediminis TaxID=2696285 RepID=UPI001430B516|nr:HNH endonuclease [Maribellus sediminis]